jgi:hypothetical protein
MEPIQTPTPEDKQSQESCWFKQSKCQGRIKGVILILLGLIIAVPSLGRLFSQYFHIFIGTIFVAWGIFILFFKNKMSSQ